MATLLRNEDNHSAHEGRCQKVAPAEAAGHRWLTPTQACEAKSPLPETNQGKRADGTPAGFEPALPP
jgi:hypothetical protein